MIDANLTADMLELGRLAAGHKYCTNCGEDKEIDGSFDKDTTKPDGYRDVCKKCRKTLRTQAAERSKLTAQFAEMEKENLQTLSTLTTGGALNPHCSEMLESLMEPFGGQRGYSKHLWAEYMRAPPGGQLRFKYMQMIMELCKQVSKLDLAERRLDMLDDDDVIKEMKKYITSYQQNLNLDSSSLPAPGGGVIDIAREASAPGE